jgi:hypothetical protein
MTLDEQIDGIVKEVADLLSFGGEDYAAICDIAKQGCYAAIRAYAEREPSGAMQVAGVNATNNGAFSGYIVGIYRAMQQQALKELGNE